MSNKKTSYTPARLEEKINGTWIKGQNKLMFMLFAEFLGYYSPLVDWITEGASEDSMEPFKKRLLLIDANFILFSMLEEYSVNELKEWWDMYYPFIESCFEKVENKQDDMPF